MEINELKEALESAYEMCDIIQEKCNWEQRVPIRDILKVNLTYFAMYIASSDGSINYKEAEIISMITGGSMTPAAISNYIKEQNIYSTEFEETLPEIFNILVQVDNGLEEIGVHMEAATSEMTAKAFGLVAGGIEERGDCREALEKDWKIYAGMIEKFLNENLNSRKSVPVGPKTSGKAGAEKLDEIYHFVNGLKENEEG